MIDRCKDKGWTSVLGVCNCGYLPLRHHIVMKIETTTTKLMIFPS